MYFLCPLNLLFLENEAGDCHNVCMPLRAMFSLIERQQLWLLVVVVGLFVLFFNFANFHSQPGTAADWDCQPMHHT